MNFAKFFKLIFLQNTSGDSFYLFIISAIEIFYPLTTNILYDTDTSQLICNENQSTGFYMMENIGREWVDESIRRKRLFNNKVDLTLS